MAGWRPCLSATCRITASKEGDDRVEAKIDALLLQMGPNGEEIIRKIDDAYEGRHTDPFYKNPVITKSNLEK